MENEKQENTKKGGLGKAVFGIVVVALLLASTGLGIYNAISDKKINKRIDEIELTPGPQGQTGQTGENGKDGLSIVSITKASTSGLVDTYEIIYSDNSTSIFKVTNGEQGMQGEKGPQGIQGIQGVPGKDGHTPTVMIDAISGNWIIDGVDSGFSARGLQGEKGVGITSIEKTLTNGLVDTYVIYYSDGTSSSFEVTNGAAGACGEQGIQGIQGLPGKDGHTPVINIDGETGCWVVDGVTTGLKAQGPKGKDGVSVVSIKLFSTKNNIDKYEIEFSNGTFSYFTVTNGSQGEQGIQGEQGPQGEQGIQGLPGEDGHTPVITIDPVTKNWIIDGVDTGICSQGSGSSFDVDTPIYKYVFQDYDGTILDYGYRVEGGTPVYRKETPTRTETGFTYEFIGWDKEIGPLTDHTTYTAQYKLTEINYSTGAYPQTLLTDEEIITELNKLSTDSVNGYYEYEGLLYYKYNSSVKGIYFGEHYYRVEPIEWVTNKLISDIGGKVSAKILDQFQFTGIFEEINSQRILQMIFPEYENLSISGMFFDKPTRTTYICNLIHTEDQYKFDEKEFEYASTCTDFALAKGVQNNQYWTADGRVYKGSELIDGVSPTSKNVGVRYMVAFTEKK